jgi:malate/lactate dehydrogenase
MPSSENGRISRLELKLITEAKTDLQKSVAMIKDAIQKIKEDW